MSRHSKIKTLLHLFTDMSIYIELIGEGVTLKNLLKYLVCTDERIVWFEVTG